MMDTPLLVAAVLLSGVSAVLALFVLLRHSAGARADERVHESLHALTTRLEVLKAQGVDLERDLRQDLAIQRNEQANAAQMLRTEVGEQTTRFTHTTQQQFAAHTQAQSEQLKAFAERLAQLQQTMLQQLSAAANAQASQAKFAVEGMTQLRQSSDQRLEAIRVALEQRLDALRSENAKKLDEMRATVDEKLEKTLEQRLGASFKQVSDRLEQVHRGLGEMQTLAAGVGDLKRVLTNVKSRGVWGEVQLSTLLSEALTPQQYASNVETVPGTNRRVEFAIRLPGKGDDERPCWLPIDCKFPLEDWRRLHDALERADLAAADESRKSLMDFMKQQAKTIRDLYVSPPFTTDFAILFVPTEGLYAEIMARPGFAEMLQREYRVMVTGPTNFLALLNSLQMGFRTLAIEQRSSEVWKVLGAVKTDFLKFSDILAKTQKKLQEASNTIDEARGKSTTISRKLRDVEALPEVDAVQLLEGVLPAEIAEDAADEPR